MNYSGKKVWERVSKRYKCAVCEHDSWCMFCSELKLALCMRVESERPSKNAMGGWIHDSGIRFTPPKSEPIPDSVFHADVLIHGWRRQTTTEQVEEFANDLGLSSQSLYQLGIGWAPEHRAFAFPMFDENGKTIGIRLRNKKGEKWAVKGSHNGLFVPDKPTQKRAFICEGPTDTAACLSMGFFAIGRACCTGFEEALCLLLRRFKIPECILVLDNDGPGVRGAAKLISLLKIPFRRFVPPAKDMREFLCSGGSEPVVEMMLKQCRTSVP